jgi:voltage-gated potassium channel
MKRASAWRLLVATALLVGLFYAVPIRTGPSAGELVLRLTLVLACVAGAAVLIFWQVRRQLRPGGNEPLVGLLLALMTGVIAFALADYLVAVGSPGQFAELTTRTDALYFALSTLATVGFGDVHAQGQAARVLVILQMLFNVGVIATGASLLLNQLTTRARERQRQRG